jgi:hypothetical protein
MGTFILCHALISYGFEILDIDATNLYGRLPMRILTRFFRFRKQTRLPDDVNRLLSSHRVLRGRTVLITSRRGPSRRK